MLPLEVRKYLYDIRQACELLHEFTAGKTVADCASHAMLRAAGVFFEPLLKRYCVKPLKRQLLINTVDNDYIIRLKRIHKRRRSASGISQRLSPIIAATVIHHLDACKNLAALVVRLFQLGHNHSMDYTPITMVRKRIAAHAA